MTELSWLDAERLNHLLSQAFASWQINQGDAFLLGFDQDAEYDSPNYLWFRDRFERFVYVDRIVVSARARGQGHARTLYRDLFEKARLAGHDRVVCEVNADPPNPASDSFHAKLGFAEIGVGTLNNGEKIVRYYSRSLGQPA